MKIPASAVEQSEAKKRKSKKTLAQLPVYRAAANMKFIVTALMMKSPRKLTKFFDQMLDTVAETKKSIGMADISRKWAMFLFRNKKHSYERFVDDFDVKCDDLKFLMASIPKMERFLKNSLKLELHKHKRYLQPVSHGVALVGAYIKPGRVYLSNRTLARFEERAIGFSRIIDGERELNAFDCKRIEQVINSYLGFCKGKQTYNRRKDILGKMGANFFKYFYIKGHYESIRAKRKYRELVLPYPQVV